MKPESNHLEIQANTCIPLGELFASKAKLLEINYQTITAKANNYICFGVNHTESYYLSTFSSKGFFLCRMALAQLEETTNRVRTLNEELRQKTERVKEVALAVAEEYPNIARNPANPLDVQDIQSELDNLNDRFSYLQEQLSDKVVITFVGATNSGKSSLINALLRDDRLPVSHGETTMCAIKVCTTEADEWKFYLHGNELPQNTIEEVKELLSRMSGEENEDARTQLQLETRSVVQIDWPKHLCKWLPENIVLYDTPGFNVDRNAMNLIEEWCRKADIIVAVMDVSSSALVEVRRHTHCRLL